MVEKNRTLNNHAEAEKLCNMIQLFLDENKAEDIVCIDLTGKAEFAHYMVIASGTSQRHIDAMAEKLLLHLKQNADLQDLKVAGRNKSGWIVIDAIDVVVHLFQPDDRAKYNLEKMWEFDFSN